MVYSIHCFCDGTRRALISLRQYAQAFYWRHMTQYRFSLLWINELFVCLDLCCGWRKTKSTIAVIQHKMYVHNSFPASGGFCRLLITFANILDPDQARQNVGPDLDPNCLTLRCYSWKMFLKKVNFKKKSADDIKACKITQHAKR